MGKKKQQKQTLGKTVLGQAIKDVSQENTVIRLADYHNERLHELDDSLRHGLKRDLLVLLNEARTVRVDPGQAVAAAQAAGGENMFQVPHLPFPVTAFEFPEGIKISSLEKDLMTLSGMILFDGNSEFFTVMTIWEEGQDRWSIYSDYIRTVEQISDYLDEIPEPEKRPLDYWVKAAIVELSIGLQMLMECLHVELVETDPYPPAHRAAGKIRYEVVIDGGSRKTYRKRDVRGSVDFSHRFERRGHFKHHWELTPEGRPNPIFAAAKREKPEKILEIDGRPCVRIWASPTVVGPEDKPLVIKRRVVRSQHQQKGQP